MSFDFPFVKLFGVRQFCYYPYELVQSVADYPLIILGSVPTRAYENEEVHKKNHFVWCTSALLDVKQKMTK
jgi:hypothetical protein